MRVRCAGISLVFALLFAGCSAGDYRSPAEIGAPVTPVASEDDPMWAWMVTSGERQTRGGLELTLLGAGAVVPDQVLAPEDFAAMPTRAQTAKAFVVVSIAAHNPTSETITLPVYTSSTLLVNDEQLDMDMLFSTVETEILPNADIDMALVFLTQRYAPDEIRTLRFVLEKELSFSRPASETTYDFQLTVPDVQP